MAFRHLATVTLIGLALGVAPAMATTPSPPGLAVRAGVHDDFERIVFDWPTAPTLVLRQNGENVILHFSARAQLDLAQIAKRKLTAVVQAVQIPDPAQAIVHLVLRPQWVASTQTVDGRVIVDFRPGIAPKKDAGVAPPIQNAVLIAAETAPSQPAAPVSPVPPAPAAADMQALPEKDKPQTGSPEDTNAVSQALSPKPEETGAPTIKSDEDEKIKAEAREKLLQGEDATIRSSAVPVAGDASYSAPDIASYANETTPLLVLDPGLVTGVAAYRRADFVYIVFDKKLTEAARTMQRGLTPVKLEEVDAIGGSAYRFYLPQDVSLRVARENSLWLFFIAPKARSAPISMSISPQPDYALGARLLVPMGKPGDTVRLYDPQVGDQLLVVPLSDSGQAVRQSYTYADMQFLPAEQGLVVRPRVDGIEIKRQTGGLEIIRAGGLRLSPERDTGLVSTDSTDNTSGARLFDFSAWFGPKSTPYTLARQKWERALSEVPENERDRIRLEMARFYFAHQRAQEALGLIDLVARNVPDIEKRSEFLALRGAVRILARHTDGLADLENSEIRDHPEIKLWRAVGEATRGNWKQASTLFTQADTVLASYPDPLYTDFSLKAVDAGLAADDRVYAASVLDRLVQRRPDMERQSAAVNYLRGVFMSLANHLDRAELLWKRAAEGDDRLFRVRAELSLTDLYVVQGKIKPLKAAERLERLRYAWRGDDLELDVLRRLGKFYIEAGKVEEGLSALKQVLAFLPENQAAQDLRTEMAQVFRDVFLGESARKISALDALSLYERFYDLAPPGEEGDAIIRTLAERMVAVDLLDRAAGLLADQVRNRLSGELKGRVGTQAAGIYLLDHKPEAAQVILADSEEASLPDDIKRERTILKAKALSDLGHNDQALQLLQDDKEEYAMRLKADIAWRARDWASAAKVLEPLVGAPPEKGTPLKAREAQLVINRAIALAMSNDIPELDKLRTAFAPAMGATPQADLFKMLTQPEAGLPKDQNALQSFMADVDLFSEYLEGYRKLR